MTFTIRPYTEEDANLWDEFVTQAFQATLLHTRRFLSYHGDRFKDLSVLIESDGKLVGLLPAAEDLGDAKTVVTHPGVTYGGFVTQGKLAGDSMVEALEAVGKYYVEQGYEKLIYKVTPSLYHKHPAQDDLYALFRLNANRFRCDLSVAIDLDNRLPLNKRRKRSLKKAQKEGVVVQTGMEYFKGLWDVLAENLKTKHGATPVHSLDEITLLAERFPEEIKCVVGLLEDEVVAGIVLFKTPVADHAQYIASSAKGYEVSALDAVFDDCINRAADDKKRWFNFGICTEDGGRFLNGGLYRFKTEFGGAGQVHDFYELDLLGLK